MGEAQRAHHCRLSRTNGHGVVYVCDCGAIGVVHRAVPRIGKAEKPKSWNYGPAEQAAVAEYSAHVKASGPMTATLDPSTHAGLLLNTKRFGHS